MNISISNERKLFLKNLKRNKSKILFTQIFIVLAFLILWELLAKFEIINPFITSQPSRIIATMADFKSNNLLLHIGITCLETIVGFTLGSMIGTLIASLLWWSKFASNVSEPFLIILHALPKVALGPIIIVWAGAGTGAIIVMALAISTIVTILEMLNGFNSTDPNLVKMITTFGASKWQVFKKIIFPSNVKTLINSMKVNIGLSLVGVISGEFLVSKAGLGYLITYGGQVFKLDLVMTSVLILGIVAAILYKLVELLDKLIQKYILHSI